MSKKGVQMLLRKASLALLATSILCTNAIANETHVTPTTSLGYQRGHIRSFGEIQGGNIRLQHETSSPWGFMGSLSVMKSNWRNAGTDCKKTDTKCRENYNKKHRLDRNAEYYSAMMGPTFRLSDKLGVFPSGGISHTKVDNPLKYDAFTRPYSRNGSTSSEQFAYSTGMTFDATRNLALIAGIEGSQATSDSKKYNMNSVFANVGYHF